MLASCGGGAAESESTPQSETPAQGGSTTTTPPPSNSPTPQRFTVSTSISTGGQISAAQVTVNEDETAEFILTPDANFTLLDASGCGGRLTNNVFTTGPITADCTVSVTFTPVLSNLLFSAPILQSASASSTSAIALQWLESSEQASSRDDISYNVYVSEQANFLPSAENETSIVQMQQVRIDNNRLSITATVGDLQANTQYYVQIGSINGEQTSLYSNVLPVKTMGNNIVVKTAQAIQQVDAANNIAVGENTLEYNLSENDTSVRVGDIIVSTVNNGFLRKVTEVVTQNGRVELKTETAALNDIYSDVDLNANISLAEQDVSVKSTTTSQMLPTRSSISQNEQKAIEQISSRDINLLLSGPKTVTFTPNQANTYSVVASTNNDPKQEFFVSDLKLVGVTHINKSPNSVNFGAQFLPLNPSDGEVTGVKQYTFNWQPTNAHLDTFTSQPFIATFRASVAKKDCSDNCAHSTTTLRVKMYVQDATESVIKSSKSIDFASSQEVDIRASGAIQFSPNINVAAKIQDSALVSASSILSGMLEMQVNVKVNAEQKGNVVGVTELYNKPFSQTLLVGEVPVVLHGDIIVSAQFEASTQGTLDIEQSFDIAYYLDTGFEYTQGIWKNKNTGKPTVYHALNSAASSQLDTKITLLPQMRLWFYETPAGRINIESSYFSDISVVGEFPGISLLETNDETNNYSFTELSAGLEGAVELRSNYSVFDLNVPAWPNDSSNVFSRFVLNEKLKVYGLGSLSVNKVSVQSPLNSCAVSAQAEFAQVDTYVNSSEWVLESAKWQIFRNGQIDQTQLPSSQYSHVITAQAKTFSDYTLRVSGFSQLGAWARQYADVSFNNQDTNNDFLPDAWSQSFFNTENTGEGLNLGISQTSSISGAATTDEDGDGLNKIDEFLNCTFPNKIDSDNDGMPDGWEVSNSLNPSLNDANDDSDGDNRSNIQEFYDKSNPKVIDQNSPPIVSGGQNITVDALSRVTLSGSASDAGEIASLTWLQTAGPLVGVSGNVNPSDSQTTNNNLAQIVFTAPDVSQTTNLSFTLTAMDNSGVSAFDQVTVTVTPLNRAPTAIAGADLSLTSGQSATLDGSSSFDSDGTIVNYQWLVQDAQTLSIDNLQTSTLNIVAPPVNTTRLYTISLTVTDDRGSEDSNSLTLTVNPIPVEPQPTPPVTPPVEPPVTPPTIENPIDELVFSDPFLTACISEIALANNWQDVSDVISLNCSARNITNTQGIEQLTALETLDLSDNAIVNINVLPLGKLTELDLSNNQLLSIDVSNNTLLELLKLNNNNLSEATLAYLSGIDWINILSFDEVVQLPIEPTQDEFILNITLEDQTTFNLYTDQEFEYDYQVSWGDGTISEAQTDDSQYTYTIGGEYQVRITGKFPALKFCENNNGCSAIKIDVLQWGSNKWLSMKSAFAGLSKIAILAQDVPDLSLASNLSFMFYKTPHFNSDVSDWNTSAVSNMNFMFGFAESFNGDISKWDTSAVTNMGGLFYNASSFNNDISQWNTQKVTQMHSMFAFATNFNTDISQWDTSAVTRMTTMFLGATRFNGDLSLWDVSAVENMDKMFYNATSMSGDLRTWNISPGTRYKNFTHADSLLVEPIWPD